MFWKFKICSSPTPVLTILQHFQIVVLVGRLAVGQKVILDNTGTLSMADF